MAGSIAELEKQIATKSTLPKTARESLVETEHQLKDLGQILKYAEQYKANRIYHIRYQKSQNKDGYLRRHETHCAKKYAQRPGFPLFSFPAIPKKKTYPQETQ